MATEVFHKVNLPAITAKVEEDFQRNLTNTKKGIDNVMLAVLLLNSEGFNTGTIDRWKLQYPYFDVTDMTDFTKVHAALGECEEGGMEPAEGADGRERMVVVTVRPKDPQFHTVAFRYKKQLPKPDKRKGEQPKCRLKTVTTKRTILVCEK